MDCVYYVQAKELCSGLWPETGIATSFHNFHQLDYPNEPVLLKEWYSLLGTSQYPRIRQAAICRYKWPWLGWLEDWHDRPNSVITICNVNFWPKFTGCRWLIGPSCNLSFKVLNMSNQTDCMVPCLTEETVGGSLFADLCQLSLHGANRAVSCKHEEVQGASQSLVEVCSSFSFEIDVASGIIEWTK